MSVSAHKVSIVMTVSSTSSTIDEALQTVLDQTVDDIEVIVVVPPDVEASLRHLEDPRVRVYERSVEEGSNHQRPVIHGEYVAYADGSVRWSPDYLHRALAEFDQEKLLVRVSWNWQKMSGQEVEAVAAAHRRFGIPPARASSRWLLHGTQWCSGVKRWVLMWTSLLRTMIRSSWPWE